HHTASAILALEAFEALQSSEDADTWKPRRLYWNSASWARRSEPLGPAAKVEVGGYSALLGESYTEVAARSRSMHKSQGFGSVGSRGEASEDLELIGGDAPEGDFMAGIDTSWSRFQGGVKIDRLAAQ